MKGMIKFSSKNVSKYKIMHNFGNRMILGRKIDNVAS